MFEPEESGKGKGREGMQCGKGGGGGAIRSEGASAGVKEHHWYGVFWG